jgi:hypothetical protein
MMCAAVLAGTMSCACQPRAAGNIEFEDCDAEDFANREDDCGFTDADRKKLRKGKTPATKAPAPKTTRKR